VFNDASQSFAHPSNPQAVIGEEPLLKLTLTLPFCILAASITPFRAAAQSPDQDLPQTPPPGATILHTGIQLVVVDVVVRDKDGHPIHGLKREDFILSENKAAQSIRNFDEHTATARVEKAEPLPPQPPGVFTNYTDVPSNGVLNVLLLDNLNTPLKDQAYVLNQLKSFVKKAPAGTRIAIFGLSSSLYFLQGFTSDPSILKDVVDHKLIGRGSMLLNDVAGNNGDTFGPAAPELSMGMGPGQIAFNMNNFETEQQTLQTLMRMEYTLDAFNVLARYLTAFPGHKNLIWFSASFPLAIVPDITLSDPFAVMGGDMEAEYRQTTNLLTKGQIAVYPVDAQGLASDPTFDSAKSGAGYSRNPGGIVDSVSAFLQTQAEEHQTMMAIAEDTGGEAYFNTNDLAGAVSKAIDNGSNFYTLTYSPPHAKFNDDYRTIKVELTKSAALKGATLSYRHGYYSDAAAPPAKANTPEAAKALANSRPTYNYAAVMSRGAPTPTDIVFRVRVLPASNTTEDTLAPENQLNPKLNLKPPYRRFDIDISAPGSNFAFKVQNNGNRVGGIEFLAFAFDSDGKLLNATTKSVPLHQTPAEHQKFVDAKVGMHLELSAPAKGETFIRIAIHDLTSDTFGAVEVPTAAVIKLHPPTYPKR